MNSDTRRTCMSALAAIALSVLAIGSSDTGSSSSSSSVPSTSRNTSPPPLRQAPAAPQSSQTASQERISDNATEAETSFAYEPTWPQGAKSSDQASATGISLKGFYVAASEQTYMKASNFLAQGDKNSFYRLGKEKQIASLPEGKSVEIVETKPALGLARIRLDGISGQYWTSIKAVQVASKKEMESPVQIDESNGKKAETSLQSYETPGSNREEYESGYEAGFIVGEMRHNSNEPDLPESNKRFLATRNKTPEYSAGFAEGYGHGFSGLARGGKSQRPLPALPIVEPSKRKAAVKSLGKIDPRRGEKELTSVLSSLIKNNPQLDLYVVRASWEVGSAMDYTGLIFDAKHKCLCKLSRTAIPGLPQNTYAWRIWFDIQPKDFSDGIPWQDLTIRMAFSSETNKKVPPLRYVKHSEASQFP